MSRVWAGLMGRTARRTTNPVRAKQMGDNAAKQLEGWCKTGLPECYKSFQDALYDWYPDLPWDPHGGRIAAEHILSSHGETLETVKATFKFDMRADLTAYLEECGPS